MTKEQRRDIYWELYFCLEAEKTIRYLDKRRTMIGIISRMLPNLMTLSVFLELRSLQIFGYGVTKAGLEKNQQVILKAIELTYV